VCYEGCGVVFKLDPTGKETVLYSFTGGADGAQPTGVLVRDASGNLYGTALIGGSFDGECPAFGPGCGVVFKLHPSGTLTVLHTFTGGTDGEGPRGVIRDGTGNLYGTTSDGGEFHEGIVFKVDTTGKETVLHSFTGGSDGGAPFAPLIRDAAGNLYGTTIGGGMGLGVVFKLTPSGKETVLHSFTGGADGGQPYAGVVRDALGNLYGTTYNGGTCCGVVFRVNESGKESVLYTFTGGADGSDPDASLLIQSGALYGTTVFGGDLSYCGAGCGVVFKLTLP
jgi:uncharacterized repeat protein (TIGR03803 family)